MVWTSLSACFSWADVWTAKPANTAMQHTARSFMLNFPSSFILRPCRFSLDGVDPLRTRLRVALAGRSECKMSANAHQVLEPYAKCLLKPLGLSRDQIGAAVSDIDALHRALPVTHGIKGKD